MFHMMVRLILIFFVVIALISPGNGKLIVKNKLQFYKNKLRDFTQNIVIGKANDVDVIVVGSGITGCTTAFCLSQMPGMKVMLAEARDVVGGNFVSKSVDGYTYEEGPNSIQPTVPFLQLTKQLGLLDEMITADPKLPRYIYWKDALHALPTSLVAFVCWALISFWAKIRVLLGMVGFVSRKKEGYDESIREFFIRHFGTQFFERVIDPFVSGVFAGDPAALSMQDALPRLAALENLGWGRGLMTGVFSKLAQAKREGSSKAGPDISELPKLPSGTLVSFRKGLQSIPNRVARHLGERVKYSHKLVRLELSPTESQDSPSWIAVFSVNGRLKRYRARALLITAPAYATADIFQRSTQRQSLDVESTPVLENLVSQLGSIPYPAVSAAVLAYHDSDLKRPLIGFGHLIPATMNMTILGTIWASSLFKDRAPQGMNILVNFIGGARDASARHMQLTDEEIVKAVDADLRKILLKSTAKSPRILGVRRWPKAIPQYNKGHRQILRVIENDLKSTPGLFLGGNYRSGVAIGDCIEYGMSLAKEIFAYLESPGKPTK